MPELSSQGSRIELGEHPGFERRWRWFQGIIFSIFAVLAVAALFGLFGSGPLSHSRTQFSLLPLSFDYQRFARVGASNRIVVEPQQAPEGHLLVHLDRNLSDGMGIESVSPMPMWNATDRGGMLYVFAV